MHIRSWDKAFEAYVAVLDPKLINLHPWFFNQSQFILHAWGDQFNKQFAQQLGIEAPDYFFYKNKTEIILTDPYYREYLY